MTKPRVLSGVQPTGSLHLGNWLGAIRNWVELQNSHDTFFCVVDLHAITVPHDPKKLAADTLNTAALYLACGIDPSKATVFVQSQVAAHAELCWLLNCLTPLNWLERMIQFKEKAIKQGDNVSVGLLDYPVLMAADILLYDADLVPVGEDQKQHLELARDIAQQRVNSRFGSDEQPILKVPKPLILKEGARVMSLTDGKAKMSKSDPNEGSRINLLDPPEVIIKKIKRAKTDPQIGLEINNPDRPEAANLLGIYTLISGL
ncbi:MAG: tryptophan--tRNA ligase, partial [Synechococcaceae bacterium WB6_1B_055]|nr:tryptophan--tRNA ligase [Synechococcaceae bacterium WB6_1B_055]